MRAVRERARALRAATVAGACALAFGAHAAETSDLTLPAMRDFEPAASAVESTLPPLVTENSSPGTLAAGARVFVRGYVMRGNRVLGDAELARLLEPYTHRSLGFEDLQAACDRVTRAYVERGYVSSWASLPDQRLASGMVEIQITEGVIDRVAVRTDGRLRRSYLEARLWRVMDGPLQVGRVERELQLLERDPNVRSVKGAVVPGQERGVSSLELDVAEERGLSALLELDNGISPSVGGERSRIELAHTDLTGWGDELRAHYGRTHGLVEMGGSYELPLGSRDTTLRLFATGSDSEVVEEPFDDFEIESRSASYGVTLSQPILHSLTSELDLFLGAEHRRSKSFLLGQAFSFAEGVEQGLSKISVLRAGASYLHATQLQAFAARVTLSRGTGALRATTSHDADTPDSRFLSVLTQLQYARRLPLFGAQIVARADVQLSDDPLLGLEQFSVGGQSSVRGYRENALVRDNGYAASLELRIPILQRWDGRLAIELTPFYDVGRAWSRGRRRSDAMTLASAGIGMRIALPAQLTLELYWADDLRELPDARADDDLQDRGFHFRVIQRF
jgi:hemolysin activation/secretion protein